jgi:two-component system nitrate/nitrite sensor histidine kinase NarX
MKIQLLRLTTLLDAAQAPAARGVADELREGVSAAYRQLRELLTTFRLQLDGKGLKSALRGVVDDLRRRTGLDAELHDELHGLELSANEQVHLLQIVREALANVERHAGAAHVAVRLARAGDGADIELSVEDDGAGVAAGVDLASARPQHFGVSIMRDRARALGGDLRVEARAGGGTRVALRFPSRPFAEPVPAVQQVDA